MRTRPLADPITITLDGEPVQAERGEPIAAALLAAGKLTLARSPKFHRPRGPACFRGACDGCLARVDETPNIMTCMTPCEDGTAVVSQNRLGPREGDLLRMTDWFFPDGMNHHELFAGIPGVQTVMQAFARRVAGLGKLPLEAEAPRPAERRKADVVVVGAGPAGMAVAARASRAGRSVVVIDDQLEPGGSMLALGPDAAPFASIRATFLDLVATGAIELRRRAVAGGVYGADLLVAGEGGAMILEPTALVLACGAHDGVLPFEGNDLPGVMSARAAGMLLHRGVVCGKRIAVVVPERGGPFGVAFARGVAEAFAESKGDAPKVDVLYGEPLSVGGTSRAKNVVVRTAKGDQKLDCDLVLVDAPRAPAYELAEQAGATLVHEPRGFVAKEPASGKVFVTGELGGLPLDPETLDSDAARIVGRL